ncbi:hypothetical protein [Propioniciclava coleopterorum]|uniref:hypothetical protein n=1 Tax=Propioniciclava coleopterorum TaxID=2714937 RepID=UPI00197F41BE|nr:hypothetical protein [Propioniciclava coleopterorum]
MALPLLVLISMGLFVLAQASPFDPLVGYLGDRYPLTTPEQRQSMREVLRLDQPWWAGWLAWASDLVSGDLGHSRSYAMPVSAVLAERLPATLLLSAAGLAVALLLSLLGALIAALNPGSVLDRATHALATFLQAVPPFVLALAAVTVGPSPSAGSRRAGPPPWSAPPPPSPRCII